MSLEGFIQPLGANFQILELILLLISHYRILHPRDKKYHSQLGRSFFPSLYDRVANLLTNILLIWFR